MQSVWRPRRIYGRDWDQLSLPGKVSPAGHNHNPHWFFAARSDRFCILNARPNHMRKPAAETRAMHGTKCAEWRTPMPLIGFARMA